MPSEVQAAASPAETPIEEAPSKPEQDPSEVVLTPAAKGASNRRMITELQRFTTFSCIDLSFHTHCASMFCEQCARRSGGCKPYAAEPDEFPNGEAAPASNSCEDVGGHEAASEDPAGDEAAAPSRQRDCNNTAHEQVVNRP